jgi:hypothetical protein
MSSAWVAVLDDFEASLADAVAALDADAPPTAVTFTPPAVDGPCPAELAGRAQALLAAAAALEDRMVSELAAVREEIRRLPRPPAAGPGESRFESHA